MRFPSLKLINKDTVKKCMFRDDDQQQSGTKAKARPPPHLPDLNGAFPKKVQLFLSPGSNLKSSKSWYFLGKVNRA